MTQVQLQNNNMRCSVRQMTSSDISGIAKVHALSFSRQLNSEEWISCNFKAHPRIQIFVAELDKEIIGYIQWIEKSGFRKEVVLELEQIAVLPAWRNQGIGKNLINFSLARVKERIEKRDAKLKHVIVTTRTDNDAQRIYRETLNASPEAIITNLFSADEVIMISRNIST